MIRSRKDEGTAPTVPAAAALHNHDPVSSVSTLGVANTNVAPTASPAAFRYTQQRTLSNTAAGTTTTTVTKTMTIATTPTIKRTNSSLAASMASHKEDKSSIINNNSAPSATAVSSFANTASVSSSLRYYHSLIQNQMYNVRKSRSNKKKSKPSDSHHHTNIWTVQMPKRMLFGTMGIFLLIPVLVFVYKEMHLPKKSELVRGNHDSSSSSSSNMSMMKKSNQEYVSWMANFLGNEEMEDDVVGAVDVNETTIDQDRSDTNDNETTGGGGLNDKNDDDAEIKESDGTTTTGTKGVDREDVHEKEEEDENG